MQLGECNALKPMTGTKETMRVVRGVRLAFQAGIEEFEPPNPLQSAPSLYLAQ